MVYVKIISATTGKPITGIAGSIKLERASDGGLVAVAGVFAEINAERRPGIYSFTATDPSDLEHTLTVSAPDAGTYQFRR